MFSMHVCLDICRMLVLVMMLMSLLHVMTLLVVVIKF